MKDKIIENEFKPNQTVCDFVDSLKWLKENDLLDYFLVNNKKEIDELVGLLGGDNE